MKVFSFTLFKSTLFSISFDEHLSTVITSVTEVDLLPLFKEFCICGEIAFSTSKFDFLFVGVIIGLDL